MAGPAGAYPPHTAIPPLAELLSTPYVTRTMTKLSVYRDRYYLRQDVAPMAVYIEGKDQPFSDLADDISRAVLERQPELVVTTLDYVDPNLDRPFTIKLNYGTTDRELAHGQIKVNPASIDWHLYEDEAREVVALLTALGTALDHVHFDPKDGSSDHAVYCALL